MHPLHNKVLVQLRRLVHPEGQVVELARQEDDLLLHFQHHLLLVRGDCVGCFVLLFLLQHPKGRQGSVHFR